MDNGAKNNQYLKPYEPHDLPPSTYIRYLAAEKKEEVHLRDYISVIIKRKWYVVAFLVSAVITTMAITLMMAPVYKSTVVIKIDKEDPNILSFKGVEITRPGPDYYTTQYELLKSRTLAEKVIKKLDLHKNKDFVPVEDDLTKIKRTFVNIVSLPVEWLNSLQQKSQGEMAKSDIVPRSDVPEWAINSLISRIEVNPVKNSQLVKVSFESNKPDLSATVTNAIAESFIEYDLESRVDASKEAKNFLSKQIEIATAKVEASEKAMNEYSSKNEIIFIDSNKSSILNQKLAEVSTALNAVTTERMQKEALLKEVRGNGFENHVILNNPLIQGLKSQHATLEAEYFNLLKTYTPDYPKMKNLKSQMDAIKDRIEKEKASIIKSIESDYNAALKKEANLTRAVDSIKRKVLGFQEKAVQYQILKREVDVNKELLNNLLQRLNEVSVAAMSRATNIQIVDRAVYPRVPFKPNKGMNLLLSILFGLMGGVGLAFLVEYFDNTVRDAKDIEKSIQLPSLGMIPLQKDITTSKRPQIVYSKEKNPVAEIFRSIGTFILLSKASEPPKSILVTSPGEKEGKSTVSLNIAVALAESLGNGIIVDADLRKPKLHSAFNIDNKIGLSTFLSGNLDSIADGKLIKTTHVKGINIITSGPIAPNPAELLFSERMRALMDDLCSRFN
ncbi:MAG: GumC family protein, partial [Thermodesulfovibrionales bacterium]